MKLDRIPLNQNLEAMAKLYDYWLVQFDFPDENSKPYKSSGGAMRWNDRVNRNRATLQPHLLYDGCNFCNCRVWL